MKKILQSLSMLALSLIINVTLTTNSFAKTTSDYLMWQLPSNVNFPVYVYSDGKQTDYLYGHTQQAFLGRFNPSSTNASYALYYQGTDSNWHSCNLTISDGNIIASDNNSCPGAVINLPASGSNVYTVAFGAFRWPGTNPAVNPKNTHYGKRKITFKNDTKYSEIQIGEICTVSVNPHNPNCRNTQSLFRIKQGNSIDFVIDNKSQEGTHYPAGLDSYAFTLTAFKDSKGKWVNTGGYGTGETPYATKIELTTKAVNTNSSGQEFPQGSTNFDVSAVDGYNVSVVAYPAAGAYCTYTVPPENSNILGAGYYSKNNPLGALYISPEICANSSQLPTATKTGTWDLSLIADSGDFIGCMSPCTFAKLNNNAKKDMFCCTGSYNTPASCDQPSGVEGANNSRYVTNLTPPTSNHIYRFAYDDAIGDFACPAETDFIISFLSLEDA
ncbi:thaumatin family protein [Shewanella woodyi]|uniref:thaumatin family protein n=1 Tax=Shewanella woodyi TaxID=60961 RepID=UPI00374804A4